MLLLRSISAVFTREESCFPPPGESEVSFLVNVPLRHAEFDVVKYDK